MQIAYRWLLEYLPREIHIEELSKILTDIGLEVESVETSEAVRGNLEGLVIGEVLSCEPHPGADKLKLTTVHVGNDTILPIVCGAPNVAKGQKVVVATVGTTVYPTQGDEFTIKKAKIRGELSEGMICAEDEIGLGSSHDGIMILSQDAVPGTPAKIYFNLPATDYTIHIGLTPNRSDGNSHLGVARDVCAYMEHHNAADNDTSWAVRFPDLSGFQAPEKTSAFSVTISNPEACPRYAALLLRNVTVGPSPEWLVSRLRTIGLRSVNNVVDATNFVLHETGQPLHAFDFEKIQGQSIVVRYAHEGSKFVTLDDKERSLNAGDLMICDAEQALCMAGVFGGKVSAVSENTKDILLESAYFDPRTIRRSSMRHGLRTDAATHFEKGVDIEMVLPALKRAALLISEIGGGTIDARPVDIYPQPLQQRHINVNFAYINKLCGKKYSPESVVGILKALGFEIINEHETGIELKVPGNKPDVKQPADIAEEILRIDGLDKVPIPERIQLSVNRRPAPATRKWKELLANHLSGAGFQEIVTNSITNSKYYPDTNGLVKMINSLSSELDVMRPQMLESGLEVIAYNANRKMQNLRLYEIGNTYHQQSEGNYKQSSKLAIWVCGQLNDTHWQQPATNANLYYLKGIVQNLFQHCGVRKIQETVSDEVIEWKRGKQVLASAWEVDPQKCAAFDIRQAVFYAEVDIAGFTEAAENVKVKYSELPKYPSMRRDLALVLDKSVPYSKISAIAQGCKWDALKGFEVFDIFESEKLGRDKKSIALSFNFQLFDRTLTDEEVDKMMKELMTKYQNELQATVRA